MTKPLKYKIPFDQYGQLSFVYSNDNDVKWVENYIFEDTLKYLQCYHERSTALFEFISISTNLKYYMFISDFDNLLKTKGLNGNTIKARWSFHKKGQNYGIYALNPV